MQGFVNVVPRFFNVVPRFLKGNPTLKTAHFRQDLGWNLSWSALATGACSPSSQFGYFCCGCRFLAETLLFLRGKKELTAPRVDATWVAKVIPGSSSEVHLADLKMRPTIWSQWHFGGPIALILWGFYYRKPPCVGCGWHLAWVEIGAGRGWFLPHELCAKIWEIQLKWREKTQSSTTNGPWLWSSLWGSSIVENCPMALLLLPRLARSSFDGDGVSSFSPWWIEPTEGESLRSNLVSQSMTRHRMVFFKSLFHLLFQLLVIMWSDYVLSLDVFQCCRPHSHISCAVIFSSEPFNKLFEVPPDMQLRHILSWIAACLEKFIGSGLINSSCFPTGWSYC